jgi:hypothetical protein
MGMKSSSPDEIVVAASLPGGEGLWQELADDGYPVDVILVPVPDPEHYTTALKAPLAAAGRGGPWRGG